MSQQDFGPHEAAPSSALPSSVFHFTLERIEEAVVVTTADAEFADAHILYVNPAFERATGYAADELVGQTLHTLEGAATQWSDIKAQYASFDALRAGATTIYHKTGRPLRGEWRVHACTSRTGEVTHYVLTWQSEAWRQEYEAYLAAQKKRLDELEAMISATVTNDHLTRLKNLRVFNERVTEECARARRYGIPLSLFFMQLDDWEHFRRTQGLLSSDHALRTVADLIRVSARSTDICARVGDAKFAVLLPATDRDGALIAAERIRIGVENLAWHEATLTAGFGVASFRQLYKNCDEFVEAAETALQRAQAEGANRVHHAEDN
jgi:diguanylate cyclase (GGDEF)-like protein/PAS domain S-box-containing protein